MIINLSRVPQPGQIILPAVRIGCASATLDTLNRVFLCHLNLLVRAIWPDTRTLEPQNKSLQSIYLVLLIVLDYYLLMITLRHLRCLVALSDTLHFSRAAERCSISQPALSAQIAQLEEVVGVLLVERTKRRVLLTPVGREVAERGKAILRDVDEIRDVAIQAQRPLTGTLRVGILPTLGPYLLRHILPALRSRHPELRLYLREEPKNRLMRELDLGDLDLVVVSLPEADEHFTTTPLFFEPFWLTLPLEHRLAATKIYPDSIAGERLLLLEEGHCLREQALEFCRAHGALEHTAFRSTSLDSLRQMVATGLGATLLPALYVAAEARADEQIAVRRFETDPPGREIALIWRRTTSRAEEFRLFSRLLRAHLPDVVTPLG